MVKKTSAKPPPATPASNSPDWSYWGNLATVSLREALQLSLGLNPHSHVPASEPDMLLRELYWDRLLITKNHSPGADWVVGRVARESGDVDAENTELHLKKFAAWMINETTLAPFPEEFISLSEKKSQVVRDTLTDESQSSSAAPASSTDPSSLPDSATLANHTPLLQPTHLLLNRDRKSVYYFAEQPLSVLEDLMRFYKENHTEAAKAIGVDRRVLGRVLRNVRAGRKPWADS